MPLVPRRPPISNWTGAQISRPPSRLPSISSPPPSPLTVYIPSTTMPSLVDSVKSISDLIHYSRRRMPSAPDGLTATQAAPASADKPMDHGWLFNFIQDIQDQIKRGLPLEFNDDTLVSLFVVVVIVLLVT